MSITNFRKRKHRKIYFIAYLLFEVIFKVHAINLVIHKNILFIFKNHKKVFFVYKTLLLFTSHHNVGLCVYREKLDGLGSGEGSVVWILFISLLLGYFLQVS